MEEIEILSWLTLDALKKTAEIQETVGNLQSGHNMSVFCTIEDDLLELCYSDTVSNYLRRYEDKEEYQLAIEKRKEEEGEAPFENDNSFQESFEEEEEKSDDFSFEEE